MGVLKSHNSSVKVTDIVIRVSFSAYARIHEHKLLVVEGGGGGGRRRALQDLQSLTQHIVDQLSTSRRARSSAQFCIDQHRCERK